MTVMKPRTLLAAALISPTLALGTLLCVLGAGGAQADPDTSCGPGGTAQTISGVALDAEQMGNATTIVTVTADAHLSAYAAIVAVDAAYTESSLRNSTTATDHDSQGLFQQRVSIYTAAVADAPVQATTAFLNRLVRFPDWQHQSVGGDAQAVQRSAYPQRYPPNAALARALVGELWAAAAAAVPTASTSPTGLAPGTATPSSPPQGVIGAVACPGSDGALPLTGGNGGVVSGTTRIPTGLVLDGSARGDAAAEFALVQLGRPYVFGAAGPGAFDCSGLTMTAWASQGVALAHYAATQAGEGTPEPGDLSQAVSGDLVLIPGADGTPQAPGHVGIIVGYTMTTTTNGRPARDLWLVQAPGYRNLPVELTEARAWLTGGPVVAVRHIA